MDLALLRTFVTVARAGSVTVAARDLHLSQASVSRHLQRLESDLGTPLFLRRDGRRLELTDAAQRILVPATELVATAQDRWERLRELAAGRPEHIAVVVGPMVTSMPETVETLRRFHAEHPDVDVRLSEEVNSEAAGRALRAGDFDLAIRGLRDEDVTADLECREIAPLTMHAVLPNDHALAGRHRIGLADISRETFVFREGSDALRDFLAACADAWIDPHVAHLVEEPMAAIRLLTAGEAITVAWAPVGRAPGPLAHSFRMIPIETAAPRTTLTAYWLSERRPPRPALDLVEDARAQLRTWGEPTTDPSRNG
ncbi:LysR family transcriptional regulator [Capillimicrobium parvum]|uniref:HTH-type transcriptional regulator HdfR n=1 Tax=Capillimicrobium parvum TaxID=2884022 RepID=A0A9E6Y121_9ACTN|nr:LysR family transcriptional regulator [Capillimicrobium parvum]UGS37461.1 HTH-type transcriptional regulator HdfR [Capillimicrobium parvum]